MEYFGLCKLTSNITYTDFINSAPCPPPWLNYREFRDHALNQSLCMHEVCNLAKRCGLTGSEIDCSLTSTTATATDLSSVVTGNNQPFDDVNNHDDIKIILSVVWPILAVIIMTIVGISLYKERKKRAYTTNSQHTVKETPRTTKEDLELQCYSTIKEPVSENSSEGNLEQNLQNIKTTTA